jgi:hypothetical protein
MNNIPDDIMKQCKRASIISSYSSQVQVTLETLIYPDVRDINEVPHIISSVMKFQPSDSQTLIAIFATAHGYYDIHFSEEESLYECAVDKVDVSVFQIDCNTFGCGKDRALNNYCLAFLLMFKDVNMNNFSNWLDNRIGALKKFNLKFEYSKEIFSYSVANNFRCDINNRKRFMRILYKKHIEMIAIAKNMNKDSGIVTMLEYGLNIASGYQLTGLFNVSKIVSVYPNILLHPFLKEESNYFCRMLKLMESISDEEYPYAKIIYPEKFENSSINSFKTLNSICSYLRSKTDITMVNYKSKDISTAITENALANMLKEYRESIEIKDIN